MGLLDRFRRAPDVLIPDTDAPYMRRWHVIPRNRWCNVYLHEILRSDDDRALHDHPWVNVSIVLSGGYWEVMPNGRRIWRRPGSIVARRPRAAHRLEVHAPCWSLFLTGPVVREWGFHCAKGWVLWRDFLAPAADGRGDRGCA